MARPCQHHVPTETDGVPLPRSANGSGYSPRRSTARRGAPRTSAETTAPARHAVPVRRPTPTCMSPWPHVILWRGRIEAPSAKSRQGLSAPPIASTGERGHDERHQPVRQRGIDEALVRRHPLYVGGPGGGIDGQDAIELAYVQAGGGGTRPRPEEVRGLLDEPDRVSWRNAGVLLAEAGLARLIRREGPGGHQATLPLRLSGHERGYC